MWVSQTFRFTLYSGRFFRNPLHALVQVTVVFFAGDVLPFEDRFVAATRENVWALRNFLEAVGPASETDIFGVVEYLDALLARHRLGVWGVV